MSVSLISHLNQICSILINNILLKKETLDFPVLPYNVSARNSVSNPDKPIVNPVLKSIFKAFSTSYVCPGKLIDVKILFIQVNPFMVVKFIQVNPLHLVMPLQENSLVVMFVQVNPLVLMFVQVNLLLLFLFVQANQLMVVMFVQVNPLVLVLLVQVNPFVVVVVVFIQVNISVLVMFIHVYPLVLLIFFRVILLKLEMFAYVNLLLLTQQILFIYPHSFLTFSVYHKDIKIEMNIFANFTNGDQNKFK